MLRSESPHDCYGAGRAGTTSTGLEGIHVSMTGRVARNMWWRWLAMSLPAASLTKPSTILHHTRRMLVVLNDLDKFAGNVLCLPGKFSGNVNVLDMAKCETLAWFPLGL